jgi:hypothetical protein
MITRGNNRLTFDDIRHQASGYMLSMLILSGAVLHLSITFKHCTLLQNALLTERASASTMNSCADRNKSTFRDDRNKSTFRDDRNKSTFRDASYVATSLRTESLAQPR